MSSIPSSRSFSQQPSQPFTRQSGDNYVIINGRRISCDSGISGQDITNMAGNTSGRRVVKVSGGWVEKIEPSRWYRPEDLKDRNGNPVKIKTMPERTKGGFFDFFSGSQPSARVVTPAPNPQPRGVPAPQARAVRAPQGMFGGVRSDYSRALIREQVIDVARNYCKSPVTFDEDNADWVVFPQFRLPRGWSQPTTALMIMFPRDYPVLPPIGFYLPEDLPSPHGHLYGNAYHNASAAPLKEGWHWYCCYVSDGAWQPAPMNARKGWRDGDNLWTYLTLVNEVLSSND